MTRLGFFSGNAQAQLAFVFLTLLGIVGCGSGGSEVPTGSVEGSVKVNGKPLTQGQVSFFSAASGAAANADLDDEGNFKLEALPEGSYKVVIAPPPQQQPIAGQPPPKMIKINVPDKYRNEMATPLTAEIKEGENKLPPFEVKASG